MAKQGANILAWVEPGPSREGSLLAQAPLAWITAPKTAVHCPEPWTAAVARELGYPRAEKVSGKPSTT